MPAYKARDVLLLAAPHTWAASVVPAIFPTVLAYTDTGKVDLLMSVCVLLVCVLMQSAANALNDHSDYLKGTDSAENSPDRNDAVIVYGMPPAAALRWGLIFLMAAGTLGACVVAVTGLIPLVIGLVGGAAIIWYVIGGRPASYLPVGELLSGFVMGELIPLAGYHVQTGRLCPAVMLYALPLGLGIALIMLTNNGCDIERDRNAGRRTLACLLGGERTLGLYRTTLAIWMVSPMFVLLLRGEPLGAAVCAAEIAVFYGAVVRQFRIRLDPGRRSEAMRGIVNLNWVVGAGYMLALLAEVWL